MKTMRGWIVLLLMGVSMGSWAQWSSDLAQNTRVSAGFMHTFAYGAVAGDDGSVLIMWAESVGNASIMYAQRYRADGTIAFAKKEVFRYTFSDCQKEGFAGMKLLKAAGSDDVFAIFTITSTVVTQGGQTTFLQYQIVSFADGSTKIPNTGNENKGLNLGYNYDVSAPNIPFDANFIRDGGSKVVVTWHQKNNPADVNRGGGGSLVTLTDLRIAILDASNRTAPTAYFIEGDGGDQINPRVYAQGERIFVSFIDRGTTVAVRKYKYPLGAGAITREWGGNAQYLGGFSDVQNLGVQPSLDDGSPICVYTASGTGLSKTMKAHRFNPASGAVVGNVDIATADQIGLVKTTGGAFSLNFNLIYTKGNRQVIRRFLGSTTASAETQITTRNHGGDPTFEGIKISDSPEKFLLVGENRENGELYGQVIRFNDGSSEGIREWGDNGKIVSNAGANKTGGRLTILNSNAYLFLWKDERNKNSPCTSDAYAQVLDANGNIPVKPEIKNVRLSKKKFCSTEIDGGLDRTFTVTFDATPSHTNSVWSAFFVKYKLLSSPNPESNILGTVGGGSAGSTNRITATIPQGRGTSKWTYIVYVEGSAPPSLILSEPSIDTLILEAPSSKPTVQPPITLCTGVAATPLSATGTNLKWYTATTGGIASTTAPTPATATPGTISYYVTQTTNGCESLREEIKVTVTATPTIAATANTTKPLSVCAGTNVTLGATEGFTSYNWQGPGGFTNTTRNPQLIAPVSGTYIITGVSSCGTARDSVKVTVNPIPVPNARAEKTSYIVNESIRLFAEGGGTYTWTGPNGFTSTQQNPVIANAAVTMSGEYTVKVITSGCEATGKVTVSVSTQPVTGITGVTATPGAVCPGANVSVSFTKEPSNGVGVFNVFLADASGQKIGNSLGSGAASPLSVRIPDSTPFSSNYRLLVEISDAVKAQSGAFTVLQRASAQMLSPRGDTSVVFRKAGDNLNVRVRVQGSGPFTLNFSGGSRTVRNAGDTTLSFRIENETTFSFQGITGTCGTGTLSGVQSARIGLKRVVAVEEDSLSRPIVSVFPNPTAAKLIIQLRDNVPINQTTELRLFDGRGSEVKSISFRNLQHYWDISSLPSGYYVLEVRRNENRYMFKIRKE